MWWSRETSPQGFGMLCLIPLVKWKRGWEGIWKSFELLFPRRHLQNRRKSSNYAKTGRCWRWAGLPSCRERFTHFGRGVFTELVTHKLPLVNGEKQTLLWHVVCLYLPVFDWVIHVWWLYLGMLHTFLFLFPLFFLIYKINLHYISRK